MIEIEGKYNTAIIYSNDYDEPSCEQIRNLCNQEFTQGSKIRIMPDYHKGEGCTIGTTMLVADKVVPNLVGVDIGCSVRCTEIDTNDYAQIDLAALDFFIRREIPHGMSVYNKRRSYREFDLEDLRCFKWLGKREHLNCSLGTLGSGNHFIAIEVDENKVPYLLVHCGSRNLGLQVAEHYQKVAIDSCFYKVVSKELSYLEEQDLDNYLHDMNYCQRWATRNTEIISQRILDFLQLSHKNVIHTMHNYIDIENKILRKGAVSAQENEMLIIPFNMRDGSAICKGKGNADWNYSAPHGAGRLISRRKAMKQIDIEDFRKSMEGIYTTCVNDKTLDEAPMAYKTKDSVVNCISDTAQIEKFITPIYNFKAN